MSYYRELKDFILQIKGDFFLSPRDRWFLKFLEEEGYPLEVVKEGIKKFFLFHPPNRASKLPLFMSFGQIQKLKRFYIKKTSQGLDWKERFLKKLRLAEEILGRKIQVKMPEDMQSAEEILQSLSSEIAKKLWDELSREQKASLMKKFASFKQDQELFKAMIKRELFKEKGIKSLSLFVD